MIFDSHLHTTLSGVDNLEKDINLVLDNLRVCDIDKATLMYRGSCIAGGNCFASKDDMVQQAKVLDNVGKRYGDVLYPLLWLNPTLSPDFLLEIIEKYVINGNITGIKLSVQMNARDKRLEPIAEYLQKHDIPLLFHCWYKTTHKYILESDPSDIANLASKYPYLRILVAHLTGSRIRGIQDIKPHANLYIDTSGSQPEDGYMDYALKNLGADRLLFGSDHPGRDIATQLGRIYSISMNDGDREKVLYKNADCFFRKGGHV